MVSGSGKFRGIVPDIDGKFVNPDAQASQGLHAPETFRQEKFDFTESNPTTAKIAEVKTNRYASAYLSVGESHAVDGIVPAVSETYSTCFHRVLASLGYSSPHDLCRVADIADTTLLELQALAAKAKVYYEYTQPFHRDNHVSLVSPTVNSSRIQLVSTNSELRSSKNYVPKSVGVTSFVQFFNSSNMFANIQFYSGQDAEQFGGDMDTATIAPGDSASRVGLNASTRGGYASQSRPTQRDPSVSVPESRHGTANVSSGVVRPRRRVVPAKSKFNPGGNVSKSYVSSSAVLFNNLNEMYLDTISRDYAQEILEQVFTEWGVDYSDPDVAKYCEDLVFGFLIATTASNKADYNREFDVPHKSNTVSVNFDIMSRVLAEGNGVTRRQFARGVADDMRRYILEPENVQLRSVLASRVGCDPQMASLAFDGSTHCSGLTTAELSFTRLLEGRNLFEDDRVLADGASQRLMQGMSSGPRSIISR